MKSGGEGQVVMVKAAHDSVPPPRPWQVVRDANGEPRCRVRWAAGNVLVEEYSRAGGWEGIYAGTHSDGVRVYGPGGVRFEMMMVATYKGIRIEAKHLPEGWSVESAALDEELACDLACR